MAKRRETRLKRITEVWNALPERDQRFFSALIFLVPTIGDMTLSYGETPRPLQLLLLKLDRNTLFSVITRCLYLLLDESTSERAKKAYRQFAAKKRPSAAKKKSRAKRPAPKRRTVKKGPSK